MDLARYMGKHRIQVEFFSFGPLLSLLQQTTDSNSSRLIASHLCICPKQKPGPSGNKWDKQIIHPTTPLP